MPVLRRCPQLLLALLLSLSCLPMALHAEEAAADPASETAATEADSTGKPATVEQTEEEKTTPQTTKEKTVKVKPLNDRINDFFGEYIVGPMWSYFLGFSVKDAHVLMHKKGEPLKNRHGEPVLDIPKPVFVKNKDGEEEVKRDDDGKIVYADPQPIMSKPLPVVFNGEQIDTRHLHYIVLADGKPIRLPDDSFLVVTDDVKKEALSVSAEDPVLKIDRTLAGEVIEGAGVDYQGKPLLLVNGNRVRGEQVSFLHSIDPSVTVNEAGDPLLTVGGKLVQDDNGDAILLATTVPETVGLPFVVVTLVIGGLFFTLFFAFINIRLFKHAIDCVRGKFDNPDDDGEISHFKALTSALSATVGLGNIAGVAAAIAMGGPGAIFWMWLVAFFGMSMKFSSCSLSQLFRRIKDDGKVLGGPMVYLDDGIKKHYPAIGWLGKVLAIFFSVLCVGAAFGGGNMFQSNQTYYLFASQLYGDSRAAPDWLAWIIGITVAICAGMVLIGGIKRIGSVTSKMVPLMCATYTAICLIILIMNIGEIPAMFAEIFIQAFSPDALIAGGFLGVFVTGLKRAAFSNEAGLGSAAIAHAAAKTDEPVREGTVAMLGPFIDTIVVCTMTALTILVTDAHLGEGNGIELTRRAFEFLGAWAPWVLVVIVIIFAYSTIISWSYYAERCLEYLVGPAAVLPYRVLYVTAIILGPLFTLGNVLLFADLMLLSMAFPNIIGMIILSPILAKKVKDYCGRLKSGDMHQISKPGDSNTST